MRKTVKAFFNFESSTSWFKFNPKIYTKVEKTPWRWVSHLVAKCDYDSNELAILTCDLDGRRRNCTLRLNVDSMKWFFEQAEREAEATAKALASELARVLGKNVEFVWHDGELYLRIGNTYYARARDYERTIASVWPSRDVLYVDAKMVEVLPFFADEELREVVSKYLELRMELSRILDSLGSAEVNKLMDELAEFKWAVDLVKYVTESWVEANYGVGKNFEETKRKFRNATLAIETFNSID